jgi:hypothetical protein
MTGQVFVSRNQIRRALQTHAFNPAQRLAWVTWWNADEVAWGPFVAAWLDRGYRLPPEGELTDAPNTSLRSRLWPIADARPNDLGRWIREAPGRDPYDVIGYVFDQWRGVLRGLPPDEPRPQIGRRCPTEPSRRRQMVPIRDILRRPS